MVATNLPYGGFQLGGQLGSGVLANATPNISGGGDWEKNLPKKGVSEPGSDTVASMVNTISQKATDLKHDIGGAIYDARTAGGADEGQPPQTGTPALMSQDSSTPNTDYLLNAGRGALDPQAQGSKAVADAQAQQDAATQQVADAQQKGANLVPDATKDPVSHLAQRNQNVASGVGGATGQLNPDVPQTPTKEQSANATLDQTGKDTAAGMNKITWWKSGSFNQGLLAFGLNLLSGKSLAESFAVGSQIFDQHYGAEQREAWRDDLIHKGYDPLEVQRYIDTGDNKVLTSPAQKRQQMLQQQQANQLQQMQLQNEQLKLGANQYNLNPQRLAQLDQEAREDKDWTKKYQQAQMDSMVANRDLTRRNLELEVKSKETKLDALQNANNPEQMLNLGSNQQIVRDEKGRIQWNASRNRVLIRDNTTGKTSSVPIDPTTADAAAQSAQQTLGNIKEFNDNGFLDYFSMGGAAKKDFYNFFNSGREQKDWENNINQLNAAAENAAVDKLIYESPNKPNLAEVHTKAKALGHLEPGMSRERAEQVINNWKQFLSTSLAIADSQHEPGGSQLERHNVSNAPPIGFTASDGRVFQGGNPDDPRNWK